MDNDVSKISTIGSSSIRSAGLSGSNYSGFSGTTAVSSGEDLTLIKKQKHELELKLKEEVCYFLEIYSAILSWPLSRSFSLLCTAKGVFSPVPPYCGYLFPSHFFVIMLPCFILWILWYFSSLLMAFSTYENIPNFNCCFQLVSTRLWWCYHFFAVNSTYQSLQLLCLSWRRSKSRLISLYYMNNLDFIFKSDY